MTRPKDKDWKLVAFTCSIAAAIMVTFATIARAAGLGADPTPVLANAADVGISTLTQDGPWWLAIAVLHVALRVFLDKDHALKQGYLLSGLTALAGVGSAVVAWHWQSAPSAGIVTAVIAGITLLVHPVPAATPAPQPAQPGFAARRLLPWIAIGGIGVTWIVLALGAGSLTVGSSGCSNPKVKAVEHAIWQCTDPVRQQAVEVMTPTVLSVLKAGASADGSLIDTSTVKAALTKANVLSEAGVVLSCAFASAVAILEAPPAAPAAGAPAAAPLVIQPAAVHAVWATIKADQLGGADFAVAGGRVL